MVDILTDAELASYLGVEVTPAITLVTTKANELVTEAWIEPTTPVPARVWAVAMNVAVRAAANPKGLSSWTRSWDDISRTERAEGGDGQFGLFLTDDDLAALNGIATGTAGTIRTPARDMKCGVRRC